MTEASEEKREKRNPDFQDWCNELGWQVVSTALEAAETDRTPSDKDLADIVRKAANDFVTRGVTIMMGTPAPHSNTGERHG